MLTGAPGVVKLAQHAEVGVERVLDDLRVPVGAVVAGELQVRFQDMFGSTMEQDPLPVDVMEVHASSEPTTGEAGFF
ncbi:hypothetical protein [Arthrobacter rhizosphaerae]|uniref:hypothetical protein n=1 Tax=Arthrobacter rhizosphaerae TaxID=2855490 RepID=UPI0027DF27E5|nr:hypothetical protein [Arthrobacter rhizosphaerae]